MCWHSRGRYNQRPILDLTDFLVPNARTVLKWTTETWSLLSIIHHSEFWKKRRQDVDFIFITSQSCPVTLKTNLAVSVQESHNIRYLRVGRCLSNPPSCQIQRSYNNYHIWLLSAFQVWFPISIAYYSHTFPQLMWWATVLPWTHHKNAKVQDDLCQTGFMSWWRDFSFISLFIWSYAFISLKCVKFS